MSGHSKWSKIKHQKKTTDVKKGALFTKASRAITMAINEGGGISDPEHNFKLRLAIQKAKEVNMPKENIQRIIRKAGEDKNSVLEKVIYEAIGPGNTAFLIECATDNRQRTVAVVKNLLDKNGGQLADQGAVSYLFDQIGKLVIGKENMSGDQMMEIGIDAGADDITEEEQCFILYCAISKLSQIKMKLDQMGKEIIDFAIVMKPKMLLVPDNKEVPGKVSDLISVLEELDDVQKVYTNIE